MKKFMLYVAMIICIIALMFFSALLHENDILQQCIDKDRSGKATWIVELNCSPVEFTDDEL